ncbi:hypothetical protein C9374_012211 [Naegleria lovaniensis]|uniref:F-box domain-containing protein n=1 Tax=Naegleria lovaniensis TaxID=51637 RepID=A0AA88GDC8_NAELO|nr:uncharacterized protein C9374_012211 [Naegleria lovaniensis]KAG2373345.1 hypothetical protein C9374_012211 [Naegleria lovaniensis]
MKSSVECGNDELFSIFQFLDPQSILNSCVRVSQRWKQVACCNALWKYFCNSILMNDVFEWNLELERYGSYYQNDDWNDVHNDGNQMDDYYWYNVFHYIMFRIPIFKSCSIECSSNWNSRTQLEEYYDFLVPPSSYEWLERMKTPQHGNNVVEEYSVQEQDEHEYSRQILSTNEFDRYQISQQYVLAKIAALLTILSSGSHCTPNPWNDKLFLSLFEFDDKNNTWQVKRTTTISVAAFCVCQMFPGLGTMKLRQLVTSRSPQSNNLLMSIAPPIEDSSHVKPFCFFEYMDQYFETAWNMTQFNNWKTQKLLLIVVTKSSKQRNFVGTILGTIDTSISFGFLFYLMREVV